MIDTILAPFRYAVGDPLLLIIVKVIIFLVIIFALLAGAILLIGASVGIVCLTAIWFWKHLSWPFVGHKRVKAREPGKADKNGFVKLFDIPGFTLKHGINYFVRKFRPGVPKHHLLGDGEKLFYIDEDNWALMRWNNGTISIYRSSFSCAIGRPNIQIKDDNYHQLGRFEHIKML